MPIGAEVTAADGVHFRVWAPSCERIEVVFEAVNGMPAIAALELAAAHNAGAALTVAATVWLNRVLRPVADFH